MDRPRPLTEAEWQTLQEGLRSRHAATVLRSQILLASARGEHPEHIAAALGCQPVTVHALVDMSTLDGLTALGRPGERVSPYTTPAWWLVWSTLGLTWSTVHLVLEIVMGAGRFRIAVVTVLLTWTMALVCAAGGRRWALYLAIALGALCCYDMAIQHYSMLGPVDRLHVFMWQTRPEGASSAWALPYNVLVYAGTLIGLAMLWTGARAASAGGERAATKLAIAIAGLLLSSGLGVTLVPGGPHGAVQTVRAIDGALIALVIMLAAARCPRRWVRRPAGSPARRQA